MTEENNYKNEQQDFTEHNNCGTPECCGTCDTEDKDDGNREKGREGEDLSLTKEEEERLKKKIEELRKKDPFIYR